MPVSNRKSKRLNKGSAPQGATRMGVRPIPFTPASDYPTINTTKPSRVRLFFQKASVANTSTITGANLVSAIKTQRFGGASVLFSYQLVNCSVYAPASAAGRVVLTDSSSFVQSADSGSFSVRARAGISYPPAAQLVRDSNGTSNILELRTSGATDVVDVCATVTVWAASNVT